MSGNYRGRSRGSGGGPPIVLRGGGGHSHSSLSANLSAAVNNVVGVPSGSTVTSKMTKTAETLFSSHLASALNTISDSQFYQDSISPSTIRQQFETSDPSNPNSTTILLNNMKWLLASMSKGRDVSDFFPHVVKLVSCPSLEVRKIVYTYLTHYADHNQTCRDLALLSINAFQRDLADSNANIRPLALRVLTSIRVMDVLQIQILAVQSSLKDNSPVVRKCAANALAKLYPRSDDDTKLALKEILSNILLEESCTMVLSSAVVSFVEMCPERLDLLHGCFRKTCHLLTDMDEWGQIVVLDVLQRYCRTYFRRPEKVGHGSAEVIDRERRVVRTIGKDGTVSVGLKGYEYDDDEHQYEIEHEHNIPSKNGNATLLSGEPPPMDRNRAQQRKATRKTKRVVRKGFYSDEDDESSEEEVSITTPRGIIRSPGQSLASALRSRSPAGARGERRNVISVGDVDRTQESFGMDRNITGFGGVADATGAVDEDEDLDEDHRLLLRASLPLLKSRNSGVVLGVCSLHYYCGVASIKIRSALGKSLVRIYHDRREIQFVVLNSIRALVWECPSAFTPFLNDFFVKAMDPSFTRLVKLDILAALCLEPNAITAVLNELNTYIRHDDKAFVCASIRAVDKIVELARIVHYRKGEKTRNAIAARDESNKIALNCLHGLMTLSEISDNEEVVGECVSAMQRIILLLQSNEDGRNISDPNHVQGMALQRLLLLVVRSITAASSTEEEKFENELENDQVPDDESSLHKVIKLPTEKVPAALWILGEWMVSSSNSLSIFHVNKSEKKVVRTELLRLIATSFSEMDQYLKCQAVHLASKVLLSKCSPNDTSLCEFILSLGRIDVIHDVRDRSRCESMLIHMAKGIQFDAESLPAVPLNSKTVTIDDARSMLLKQRPAPSWLPIESEKDKETNALRFGTLSSMVSRKAGKAYLLLPPWAEVDSPKILRDPQMLDSPESKSKRSSPKTSKDEWAVNANTSAGFYDSDEGNSKSSDSSSSDSDSSKSSSSSSSSESDSDSSKPSGSSDDESTSSDEVGNNRISMATSPDVAPSASIAPMMGRRQIMPSAVVDEPLPVLGSRSEDESSSDDESSDGSSTSSEESSIHDENVKDRTAPASSLIDVTFTNKQAPGPNGENGNSHKSNSNVSSISLGLEGLVMAPLVIDKDIAASDDSIENESSAWHVLVRHDLSGGLEASIRFLKGSSRSREANLLGFDSKNSAVVCLQVKFENKRGDGHAIRRIHFIQKKFAKSGVLSTTRISIPQEIASLGSSKVSFAIIGLEFAQASDKDRTLLAKFDVKCDRGTTPIDLCPSLAETLQECKISRSDFDAASLKLHGIHQQAKASFNLPTANVQSSYDLIPKVILKGSNLSVVESWTDNHCKFAGKLPASGNQVLLDIQCNPSSGAGEINIFCDSAMALNPLLASIKSTITTE